MSRQSNEVNVVDIGRGELVKAMIHNSIEDHNLRDYSDIWMPAFEAAKPKLADKGQRIEDAHWKWDEKVIEAKGGLGYETYCLEVNGRTEGLMIIETAMHFSRLEPSPPQHLVYVEYLATAPWNRALIEDKPRFGTIGSVLLLQAIGESVDRGFEGRIGLHSLPHAAEFYRRKGMDDLGLDPSKKLIYFELRKEVAKKLILQMSENR